MTVKSVHTIFDGKKNYGPGEVFTVSNEEGQRLIDCGAAVFVSDEDEMQDEEAEGKKKKGKGK